MRAALWQLRPQSSTPLPRSLLWKRPTLCALARVLPVWTPSIPTFRPTKRPKTSCAGAVHRWAAAPCAKTFPFPTPANSTNALKTSNAGACPFSGTIRATSVTVASGIFPSTASSSSPSWPKKPLKPAQMCTTAWPQLASWCTMAAALALPALACAMASFMCSAHGPRW